MSHDPSLEAVLQAVEPAVRLVSERHLRQVLNYLIDWGHPLPSNASLPFWVPRSDLAAAEVLSPGRLTGTEPALLLVTDPGDRLIDLLPRAEQLRAYWEVLFEAEVVRAIDHKLASGALTRALCRERMGRFGAAAAREARFVLEGEHRLAAEADDAGFYRTFAATYLRLAAFHPDRLEDYFPSLPHGGAVPAVLRQDVDASRLLARTRPAGAADPPRPPEPDERWTADDTVMVPPAAPPEEPRGLLARASEAEAVGNHVRAAILRTQAAAAAENREHAIGLARSSLGKLVEGLGDVFAWDHDTRQEWRQALGALLEPAAAGPWPRAARCLYELQKIPTELSREVFAVDLAETIRTFGRRPVKRPLPRAKPVLILMGLRKANAQLLRAGLGHAAQLRLDRLCHHQIHHLERVIRHQCTPLIVDALDRAGLTPENTVEDVGRDKLVAELLDRVCERGYLRIGDLRDAVARNRLKLPDLRGPGEFLRGDPLLKADLNLAESLDGVYRKGEFYLRWLQRASSLFFANPVGRALFLYLVLPFVGGFMAVIGAQEMFHIGAKVVRFSTALVLGKQAPPAQQAQPAKAPPPMEPPDGKVTADEVEGTDEQGDLIWQDAPHPAQIVERVFLPPTAAPTKDGSKHGFHIPWWWVGGLSVFLFLVIHVPPFRRAVLVASGHLWRGVRGVAWDAPMFVWRSRAVREFRQSRPVRLLIRYFWSPLLITALVLVALWLARVPPLFLLRWGWLLWAVLTFTYFFGWGWVLQDRIAEAVADRWRLVRVNLIPGLIATILDLFRSLANWIERRLYAVDERLRFRGGDSQRSLVLKAALGLLWFPVAYVFRFAFNLLVEPQINPVKHFPVVTVSHKLLLPMVVYEPGQAEPTALGAVLVDQFGWSVGKANFWAFWGIAAVPGIFGFIAWELLSNWQLYRANRPDRLKPVTLGSHGESMRGVLRPGFHSGTLPKLFRKLRRADWGKADRLHHELAHVAEGIHRFVERELVHLLERSPDWGWLRLHVGEVRFGCQRIQVQLTAPSLGADAFVVSSENVGGRIEATIDQAGWTDKLTDPQRRAFVAAMRGLLDMAAVEWIDGTKRSDESPGGPGFADLARPVSWAEWVELWGVNIEPKPG